MRRLRYVMPALILAAFMAPPARAQQGNGSGTWVKVPPGPARAAYSALRDGRTCTAVANATRSCTFAVDSGFRFEIRLVGTGSATLTLLKYERDLTHYGVLLTSRTSNCVQLRPRNEIAMFGASMGVPSESAWLSIRSATPYRTLGQCTAEAAGPRG